MKNHATQVVQPVLRVLVGAASSDTRIGAVNDAIDLAHFGTWFGVRVILCGCLDDTFMTWATERNFITLRGASRPIAKRDLHRYFIDVLKWIWRLLRLRPHVVHLNYVGWASSLACAARICGIPVVARAGGGFHPYNLANRWISAYVANSQAQASSLLASPLASRVVITGDLFRPERLKNLGGLERPIPARHPGAPRFLFLGQLVERKGISVLVEAFAAMTANADLLLVGGSWETDGYPREIRQLIAARGLGARVHCENHRWDVAVLLAQSDALVLPSLAEARPRIVIEAMFTGRPVIATSVGGIPTMVEDGVTGLLVPPGDVKALAGALDRLANSPHLRHSLGEAARRRACAEFRPEVTMRKYVTLYCRLAGLPARQLLKGKSACDEG